MSELVDYMLDRSSEEIQHAGVKGMKWGVRRYQKKLMKRGVSEKRAKRESVLVNEATKNLYKHTKNNTAKGAARGAIKSAILGGALAGVTGGSAKNILGSIGASAALGGAVNGTYSMINNARNKRSIRNTNRDFARSMTDKQVNSMYKKLKAKKGK